MTNIAVVIGWKFNNQDGMKTVDGKITEFPSEIPSQADQDTWTAEYLARDLDAERVAQSFDLSDKDQLIFKMFFELINRVRVLETLTPITQDQFKTFLKNKLP